MVAIYKFYRFQSTFPRGERQRDADDCCWNTLFQSTVPRGERPTAQRLFFDLKTISIHVPTRGTTEKRAVSSRMVRISIHVPTRGTTGASERNHPFTHISIHVPTRGTTRYAGIAQAEGRFQSTFPRGERRQDRSKEVSKEIFQSTFPRGERQYLSSK